MGTRDSRVQSAKWVIGFRVIGFRVECPVLTI